MFSDFFFSSNQQLSISGPLDKEYIKLALEFALKYSGNEKDYKCKKEIERGCKITYQITENGAYCIGWAFKDVSEGWNEYTDFNFDLDIVSNVIIKHLEQQEYDFSEYTLCDGSVEKGFLMKTMWDSSDEEIYEKYHNNIEDPFYGIVYFIPYVCFYAK